MFGQTKELEGHYELEIQFVHIVKNPGTILFSTGN